jgi:hypothetical protein
VSLRLSQSLRLDINEIFVYVLSQAMQSPPLYAGLCSELLSAGVGLEETDWLGRTVMHRAVSARAVECLRLCVAAGGNVQARDQHGVSPLFLLLSYREGGPGVGISAPDVEMLQILEDGGVDFAGSLESFFFVSLLFYYEL